MNMAFSRKAAHDSWERVGLKNQYFFFPATHLENIQLKSNLNPT